MPTTPSAASRSSKPPLDRQLEASRAGSRTNITGDPDPGRLVILAVDAGVADVRCRLHHDLTVYDGSVQRLLVTGHRGGEDRLAERLPHAPEGLTAKRPPVLQLPASPLCAPSPHRLSGKYRRSPRRKVATIATRQRHARERGVAAAAKPSRPVHGPGWRPGRPGSGWPVRQVPGRGRARRGRRSGPVPATSALRHPPQSSAPVDQTTGSAVSSRAFPAEPPPSRSACPPRHAARGRWPPRRAAPAPARCAARPRRPPYAAVG